jgi:drug/metabolite transporter (DMT)-like permease
MRQGNTGLFQPPARIFILTTLAMLAFAGNSLLCRVALRQTGIDAASFTTLRLLSGALMLWLLVYLQQTTRTGTGSYRSAFALFVYAAGFSYAYLGLTAATGALLLFGAVQVTMISHGLWQGERLAGLQLAGFVLASAGLVGLLLPGLSASPLAASVLMLLAGIAWGVYSLLGGIVLLGEPLTLRLVMASAAILGGIALVILRKR